MTRHQREFPGSRPIPVLPLACGRHGWDSGPRAFPRAPNPADQEPAAHVAVGTGRTRTRSYVFDIRRTSSTSSLTSCDLVSQLQLYPAATTAEQWRSCTSIRNISASWRTQAASSSSPLLRQQADGRSLTSIWSNSASRRTHTSNTSPGIGEDQHAVPCGDARREPGPAGALPVISRSRAWSGRERSPIARICSAASPRPELSLGVIVRRGNKDTRSAIRRGGQVRVGCAGGRADRGDVRGGLGWWLLLEQRTQTG